YEGQYQVEHHAPSPRAAHGEGPKDAPAPQEQRGGRAQGTNIAPADDRPGGAQGGVSQSVPCGAHRHQGRGRRPRSPGRRGARLNPPVGHGGLYVADLDPRRGTEPGKSRPLVVIQTDLLNAGGHPSTLTSPCTSPPTGERLP